MKTNILITLLILSVINESRATFQLPDILLFEGKEYKIYSNPLESYFIKYPEKRPKSNIKSTALWRGYRAFFIIENGKLFLNDIQVKHNLSKSKYKVKWKSVMKKVFPKREKVELTWYSGILILPIGEKIDGVNMGYSAIHEGYILIEIINGNFSQKRKLDSEEFVEFKKRQFEAYKKTKEYNELIEQYKKDTEYSLEFIEEYLEHSILNYTSRFLSN